MQSVYRNLMSTANLSNRLPRKISPIDGESLRSYLMRTASANDRSSADRVVAEALGWPALTVTPSQALQLADHCRCDEQEFFQLSGIEYRDSSGSRFWRIDGKHVTKDFLIRSSRQAICPKCITAKPYLKARWDITLYTACADHRCQLLERCPRCRRLLSPRRTALASCNCGFHFGEAIVEAADEPLLVASLLIDRAIASESSTSLATFECLETRMLERLAAMSLDTLLKSLWFFGLLIAENRAPGIGRGRRRRGVDAASTIVRHAISVLTNWPTGFLSALEQFRNGAHATALPVETSRLLQVRGYLDDELREAGECAFVMAAYDFFMREWWATKGKAAHKRKSSLQLELF